VTPAAIRAAYNIPAADANTVPGLQQMAAGFLGEFASRADLAAFSKAFDPRSSAEQLTIVGPNDETKPGVEAMLDVEYIIAMGAGVGSIFWYTDGTRPSDNEPFLTWLLNVSASYDDATLPRVISISYGDNEDTIDPAWGARVGVEFQSLGARGASVLVSSGDGGVAGSQSSSCGSPPQFIPTFPAGLPWVTAVGATTDLSAETTASFSSGGFSNYWARPSWQAAAAAGYLANTPGLPPAAFFNHTGAGIPDMAAIGTDFQIVCGGNTFGVDGTSCSAPTTAGIISLLNSHRVAAGKKSLGFLNPLIYSAQGQAAFTDITTGSNPGCGTKGFPASDGWDPATGMGRCVCAAMAGSQRRCAAAQLPAATAILSSRRSFLPPRSPNYAKLLALVMSLP
jgi:tripeptidyl-peptidase-1